MRFTVAIDGPAAAGKGTISKAVAAHFDLAHLDTGLLYREVGRKVLDAGMDPVQTAKTLMADDLNAEGLRTSAVAQAASKVAVIADVRAALVDFQRAFATRSGCAVLDWRDIGTVICPRAEAKLYVTARAEIRAHRRWLELSEKDPSITLEQVLADVEARDARDRDRTEAPLVAADDAVVIDTSDLAIPAAVAKAVAHVQSCKDIVISNL